MASERQWMIFIVCSNVKNRHKKRTDSSSNRDNKTASTITRDLPVHASLHPQKHPLL